MIKEYVKIILEIVECERKEAQLMLQLEKLINKEKGGKENEIDGGNARTNKLND